MLTLSNRLIWIEFQNNEEFLLVLLYTTFFLFHKQIHKMRDKVLTSNTKMYHKFHSKVMITFIKELWGKL